VTTASTTYNEPYNLARKFATLDIISGGRAGWNVVTSWSEAEARNFSRDKHMEHATRYERAHEFVEVVRGLWDSWEDDAFLYDKESGQFYDEGRMHRLNHKGKFFSVEGPLNVAALPQGKPVLFQAGASDAGRELGAATADVVYTTQDSIPGAKAYYDDVKGRMARYGREPADLKIMPGVRIFVGRTRDEAQAKLDYLQDLLDPLVGLARVYAALGDLSGYDLDGPVPEPAWTSERRSNTERMLQKARAQNLTIRQLYQQVTSGGFCLVGTASDIADALQSWFEAEACDGFNVLPTHLPESCEDFVAFVTPELQRRGLFRTEYEGTTLRHHLGLKPATNRYTEQRRQAVAAALAPTAMADQGVS
jgi:FMN-dependent oxidoreductase (nitrilotriacetate monooxygenase family)